MKTLHHIDFLAQIGILVLSLVSAIFDPYYLFFGFYFGLGGWQFLMAILLAFGTRPHPVRARHTYEKWLLGVVITGIFCQLPFGADFLTFYYLLALLFVGGGMAFWNMSIAYRELQMVKSEHEVWDIE
ncbi:MAG TPA: hypothetical protein DIW47_06615 [Bacteroidetes bacterium]|nr:hypothetical protein [Bacteroidota bacterium]